MTNGSHKWGLAILEPLLLVAMFFAVTGVATPDVNEAHYLAKSKNFWDPNWCANDLFVSSGNPHWLFHITFGAFTQWFSLEATAWIGRLIGWGLIAIALYRVTTALTSRPLASLAVGAIWIAGTEYFNLAGEWVVGGIEGKVPAYAFVLFGIRMMIDGKWHWVWPLLGLASGFHVLVGGWSVVAAVLTFVCSRQTSMSYRSQIIPLIVGGTISLLGVYPGIALTQGVDATIVTAAERIYSYERITHHLLPSAFEAKWYWRHAALVAVTLLLMFQKNRIGIALRHDNAFLPIHWFAVGSMGIAITGLFIGLVPSISPDGGARLLRFYWFRMTDAVVPLALALGWARSIEIGHLSKSQSALRMLIGVSTVVFASLSGMHSHQQSIVSRSGHYASTIGLSTDSDNRDGVASDWIAVCEWIARTLPENEVLLTPRNQQSFKWYAGRAEVVNWKDVPQDAERLVEWSRRFFDVFPRRLGTVRVTIRYGDLMRFREEYNARFIVIDRRFSGRFLPLVQAYPLASDAPNSTYAVYRLP